MKTVVGLGACVFDTLIECKEFPKEDTKLKAENTFISGGGPVGNALVIMFASATTPMIKTLATIPIVPLILHLLSVRSVF